MGKGKSGTGKEIRIHHLEGETDGFPDEYRILIDSAWPRGVGGDGLSIDDWMPELGPTEWLFDMFGRDPARWGTFRSRYRRQLKSQGRRKRIEDIVGIARRRPVALITASPSSGCNPAQIIREILLGDIARPATRST